ncbi:hypothetical protein ACT7C3_03140 [Bacillus pacificus]
MQSDLKEKIEPYLQKEEDITKKIVLKTVELVSTRKKIIYTSFSEKVR